jgi:ABC-type cobalamin transport system permease subunit
VAEKLWRRNRVAAVALMVAVNVATAGIAAHNYSVASRLQ